MGIDATITVLTPSERRRKRRPPDLPTFELYRDWPDLDAALMRLGGPASLALRGNQPVPDEEDGDGDWVVVTPALAKKISAALGRVPAAEFLEVIHQRRKETGWRLREYECKGLIAAFDTLKAAYRLAARKGAYLEILYC